MTQDVLTRMHRYTTVCRIYERYLREHGFTPEIASCGRPETILGTAEAGMGLALSTRLHLEFSGLRTRGFSRRARPARFRSAF